MKKSKRIEGPRTIGLDLGDRYSYFCELSTEGEVVEEGRVATVPGALREAFGKRERCVVAMEAGTHSPWVSRLLVELGYEVIVANPARLRLIFENHAKSDRTDARFLAKLARLDPELLAPVQHRSEKAQGDLAVIRTRDVLVRTRTGLINHVRGAVKSFGSRIGSGPSRSFVVRAAAVIPLALRPALEPVLNSIAALTEKIEAFNKEIERLGYHEYPQTKALRTVHGVGPVVALTYVLTLEDPHRFPKSRSVAAFVGLVPRRDQSGDSDPQMRITRRGDSLLRRLLVQAAHHVLGPFGEDSDLRRHGLRICERGGKNSRKRAVTAVARRLAVLLHRLWISGQTYQPLHASPPMTLASA